MFCETGSDFDRIASVATQVSNPVTFCPVSTFSQQLTGRQKKISPGILTNESWSEKKRDLDTGVDSSGNVSHSCLHEWPSGIGGHPNRDQNQVSLLFTREQRRESTFCSICIPNSMQFNCSRQFSTPLPLSFLFRSFLEHTGECTLDWHSKLPMQHICMLQDTQELCMEATLVV